MTARENLEHQLEELKLQYRKRYSLISMMEKGTTERDLAKLKAEQLDPIKRKIRDLESELGKIL
jgi:hypothetical protein